MEVAYKGETVGGYFADIVKVLIEFKAVDQLAKAHEAQLLNYLRATGMKLGLLVNFRHQKAEIKRFVLYLIAARGAWQLLAGHSSGKHVCVRLWQKNKIGALFT